jgi:hypothetical protein
MVNQKLLGFFGIITLILITGIVLIITLYNLYDSAKHPDDVIIKFNRRITI